MLHHVSPVEHLSYLLEGGYVFIGISQLICLFISRVMENYSIGFLNW